MSSRKIPIANIYYLLCYAWRHIQESDVVRLEELGGLERLHDLLGKMLSEGVFLLIRRGIDCGYRDVCENTASVRGKILVSDTVKQALRVKGQVACNFEEMTHDVLHNQILRSTLKSLLQLSDLNPEVRTIVRNAYKKLNGVTCLPLKRQLFQRVSLDRNRQYYRFLLIYMRDDK